MHPEYASRLKQQCTWAFNRIALALGNVRTVAVLAVGEVPQRVVRSTLELRAGLTRGRAVWSVVLAAMVITPTILYVVERSRHMAQKRAYRTMSLAAATEAGFLESSVRELLSEQSRLTEILLDGGYSLRYGDEVVVKVVATGYSSSVWETDSSPFVTAANTPTRNGILAMSRDLLDKYTPDAPFSFGDYVHIPGLGDFLVEDSMNARWDNRVDIWFPSRMEALRFGVRKVYLMAALDQDAESRSTN
ncbi:MAG: 3D domain-containing protein [Candidatus Krumholzibacteriia bacterium]